MAANINKRRFIINKRQGQKRKKTKQSVLIALGIVLLIGLVVVIPNLLHPKSGFINSDGLTIGDPSAPVKVINFSSFYCGYCEEFSNSSEPMLINKFVNTGDVFYRYINLAFSSDEGTQNAAKAAFCAGEQNFFFEMKRKLYLATREQDGFSISNLIRLAELTGLDQEEFETCLLTNENLQGLITEDLRFAESVGITGTPSFLVNGQLVYSNELIPLIETLLAP